MTTPAGPAREITRSITAIDRRQVDGLGALRHGAVVALVLAAGLAWTSPAVAVACAIGSLQVGFYDGRGPYRARLEVMSAVTVSLAAVATLARFVDPYPWVAIALSVTVAFVGGLLVSLGPWASLAGTHSTVLFLIFTASPSGGGALEVGVAVLIGGGLQALVALVGWPFRPYGPEEHALQHAWITLADLGRHPDEAHDRATVVARAQASTVLALSSATGATGQRLRGLLDRADWMRLELVALGRRKDSGAARLRALAAEAVEELAAALTGPADERAARAAEAAHDLRLTTALDDTLPPMRVAAVTREVHEAAALLDPDLTVVGGPPLRRRRAPTEVFETVRDAARPGTPAFRHATRLALAVGLSLAIASQFRLDRGYWMAVTAALVLRPDYGSTLSRGLGRVAGTLAGVVLMGAVAVTLDLRSATLVLLVGLLAAATYAVLRANYALGAATMTALLVCLFEVSGQPIESTLRARTVDTFLGGAVALVVYLGWPTWQRRELGTLLAAAVRGTRAWSDVVLGGLVDPTRYSAEQARARAAELRRMRTETDAALQAARAEPGRADLDLDVVAATLSTQRRLHRALLALEVVAHDTRRARATVAAPAAAIAEALGLVISRLEGHAFDDEEPTLVVPETDPTDPSDPVPVEIGRALDATQTLLDLTRRL